MAFCYQTLLMGTIRSTPRFRGGDIESWNSLDPVVENSTISVLFISLPLSYVEIVMTMLENCCR